MKSSIRNRVTFILLVACVGTVLLVTAETSMAACAQRGMQIKMVGVETSNGTIYVNTTGTGTGGSGACADTNRHKVFYFHKQNADTEAVLRVLLAAKLSGSTIRVDKLIDNDKHSARSAYLE